MKFTNDKVKIHSSSIINNISKCSINYIISNILKNNKIKIALYIVDSNFEIELFEKEIKFFYPDINILKFPEWNTIPYDVNSPRIEIQSERIKTLYKLVNYNNFYKEQKTIVITTKKSILQKIINRIDLNYIKLSLNQNITIYELEKKLISNCYTKTQTSRNTGDYSINSNIIDIVSFNNESYRITLNNNSIKEIKFFNTDTQISYGKIDDILILPIREVVYNQENIENFKLNYRNIFGIPTDSDILYKNISNNILYNGFENWLPLFYKNNLEIIFDYLPKNTYILYTNRFLNELDSIYSNIINYYQLRCEENKTLKNKSIYNPIQPQTFYIDNTMFLSFLKNYNNIIFDIDNNLSLSDYNYISYNSKDIPNFIQNSKETFILLKEYLDTL